MLRHVMVPFSWYETLWNWLTPRLTFCRKNMAMKTNTTPLGEAASGVVNNYLWKYLCCQWGLLIMGPHDYFHIPGTAIPCFYRVSVRNAR